MDIAKKRSQFIALLQHYSIYQPLPKYKIVCPFHGDKNASLQINIDEAYFFCYGCQAHGGPVELYKAFYHLEHPKSSLSAFEASCRIESLTKAKTGTQPQISPTDGLPASYAAEQSPKAYLRQSRNYYYSLPTPNWYRPSNVLEIVDETNMCREYLHKRGFTNSLLTKYGAKPTLNTNYPVVFPLLENGIFRGYIQRTFSPEIEAQRKYLYNKGFRRQTSLPGIYGKKANSDTVLIVEGYIDCLKALQFGVKSCVAILGWKISTQQIVKLQSSGIKKIVVGLDNDEVGNKGYKYLRLIEKKQDFSVFRLRYPKNIKDFGDLQKGTPELLKVLRQLKFYNLLK